MGTAKSCGSSNSCAKEPGPGCDECRQPRDCGFIQRDPVVVKFDESSIASASNPGQINSPAAVGGAFAKELSMTSTMSMSRSMSKLQSGRSMSKSVSFRSEGSPTGGSRAGFLDSSRRAYQGPQEHDIDVDNAKDELLLNASRAGDFAAVVDAVADGANIHCRSKRGMTALQYSATCHEDSAIPIIEFLCKLMASIEARDQEGWTSLHYACRTGQVPATKYLVECKASIHNRTKEQHTPLMLAAVDGCCEIIHRLHQMNADVDSRDSLGWTALMHSIDAEHFKAMEMLLRLNASPLLRANDGLSCMMIASQHGHPKVIKYLRKRNVGVNIVDRNGNSALMHAIMSRRLNCAFYLLRLEGIEWRLPNKGGITPLEAAKQVQMGIIVKWIDERAHEEGHKEQFNNDDGDFGF